MGKFITQLVKVCGQKYVRNFEDLVVSEMKRDIRIYAECAPFVLLSYSVCVQINGDGRAGVSCILIMRNECDGACNMEPVVSLCIVLPEKFKEATRNTLFLGMVIFITLNFSYINQLNHCDYYMYHLLGYTEYVYVFRVILITESDYFINSFKRLVFVMETQFTFSGRGTEF